MVFYDAQIDNKFSWLTTVEIVTSCLLIDENLILCCLRGFMCYNSTYLLLSVSD